MSRVSEVVTPKTMHDLAAVFFPTWQSPALERDISWQGEMTIPQDLPSNEMIAQNSEQMALTARVTREDSG